MLLRIHQVKQVTGLGRSTVYNWVKAGTFPAPIKLGPRSVAWVKEEIEAWVAARLVVACRGPRVHDRGSPPRPTSLVDTSDGLGLTELYEPGDHHDIAHSSCATSAHVASAENCWSHGATTVYRGSAQLPSRTPGRQARIAAAGVPDAWALHAARAARDA
jgi:prophage regulatory protein